MSWAPCRHDLTLRTWNLPPAGLEFPRNFNDGVWGSGRACYLLSKIKPHFDGADWGLLPSEGPFVSPGNGFSVTGRQTHPVLSYCKCPNGNIKRKVNPTVPDTASEHFLISSGRNLWLRPTLAFLLDPECPLAVVSQKSRTRWWCCLLGTSIVPRFQWGAQQHPGEDEGARIWHGLCPCEPPSWWEGTAILSSVERRLSIPLRKAISSSHLAPNWHVPGTKFRWWSLHFVSLWHNSPLTSENYLVVAIHQSVWLPDEMKSYFSGLSVHGSSTAKSFIQCD